MVARKKRNKQRNYAKQLESKNKRCPNCGEFGEHYVPPSLGEKGFFICFSFKIKANAQA